MRVGRGRGRDPFLFFFNTGGNSFPWFSLPVHVEDVENAWLHIYLCDGSAELQRSLGHGPTGNKREI